MVGRRLREKLISKAEMKEIVAAFESDWARFGKTPVTESVIRQAARLSTKHPLRSLDAIHLASAVEFQSAMQEPTTFLTTDKQLASAAVKEGLNLSA